MGHGSALAAQAGPWAAARRTPAQFPQAGTLSDSGPSRVQATERLLECSLAGQSWHGTVPVLVTAWLHRRRRAGSTIRAAGCESRPGPQPPVMARARVAVARPGTALAAMGNLNGSAAPSH
jgi:hypothetical protein